MSGMKTGTLLMAAAGAAIAATVVAAIVVMGSPAEQRERRIDARRVQDLLQLQGRVDAHYREHDALPDDLGTLAAKPGLALAIADPVTGEPYGYEKSERNAYRLCAVFTTDSAADGERDTPWMNRDWAHGAGRTCFARKAGSDKD